ncbi:GD25150 [Drosophila simulans]|uniref:Sugar phosphate phosphatase n=1 Tax=Drosophila simulans TaxID=7240 RepID=B4QH13_DROSI|nr:GD25150 [Drosophila simulans]
MYSAEFSSRTDVTETTNLAAIEQLKEQRFNEKNLIIYNPPGENDELSARFLRSLAFATFKRRSPAFLRDLIIFLQDRETDIIEQCGEYAHFDLKRTIWSLELLRDDIINNRDFQIFRVKAPDTDSWNSFIKGIGEDRRQWFSAVWLHADCYMYRRIWSIFQRSETLKNYDYFGDQKTSIVTNVAPLMRDILVSTKGIRRSQEDFQYLLKLSAWSNHGDLNITRRGAHDKIYKQIAKYDIDLLADQSSDVWQDLTEASAPVYVDIVCDNAGFELFADLLLGEYIIESGLASRRIRAYIGDRSFILCDKSYFWTSGHDCSQMKRVQPCLYVYISQASLVIFKGDLNYRKLLGDINYKPTTQFSDCLRGFQPASVCALRVIKSDIYCGLPLCTVEKLSEQNPEWMVTGDKAVVQVAIKHRLSSDIIV